MSEYTVQELREALEGLDGDRKVQVLSQGAIDDVVNVAPTEVTWNTGRMEKVVQLQCHGMRS